jgi:hypothetical protein
MQSAASKREVFIFVHALSAQAFSASRMHFAPIGLLMANPAAVRKGIARSEECSWNRKVSMCKFYQLGKCDRGAQCTFAHSADELRIPGSNRHEPSSSSSSVMPKARPGATRMRARSAATPTASENEQQRKQQRHVYETEVVDDDEAGKMVEPEGDQDELAGDEEEPDALVADENTWHTGDRVSSSTCLAVLPNNGPLVWVSPTTDLLDDSDGGFVRGIKTGVIVKCEGGTGFAVFEDMHQVSAYVLDSMATDYDSLMPIMFNTCMQVLWVTDPMCCPIKHIHQTFVYLFNVSNIEDMNVCLMNGELPGLVKA